jgi:transcriptional regulator with GAF, ATPase, and Fis domain
VTSDLLALRSASDRSVSADAPAPLPAVAAPRDAPPSNVVPFSEAERRAILRALETTGWRISGPMGAATLLGLKPTTLHAKMKKLGIRRPSARDMAADRA